MEKDLRPFCHSAAIYTRIRNALWYANDGGMCAPASYEPAPDDFLRLDPKTIIGIGPRSLKILNAWVNYES